jgi:hypothetical protein
LYGSTKRRSLHAPQRVGYAVQARASSAAACLQLRTAAMAGGRRARAASCLLTAAAAAATLSASGGGAAAEPALPLPGDVAVLDMIPTWWTVRGARRAWGALRWRAVCGARWRPRSVR